MCTEVGNDAFNVYNMYDTCYPDHGLSLRDVRAKIARSRKEGLTLARWSDALHTHPALFVGAGAGAKARGGAAAHGAAPKLQQLNDYSCGSEDKMQEWLSSVDVQKALHVEDKGSGMHYRSNAGDLRSLYARLVAKYKIVIYSGNVDSCVPTSGRVVKMNETAALGEARPATTCGVQLEAWGCPTPGAREERPCVLDASRRVLSFLVTMLRVGGAASSGRVSSANRLVWSSHGTLGTQLRLIQVAPRTSSAATQSATA